MNASLPSPTQTRIWTKQRLFGIPIDALRLDDVLDIAEESIGQRRRLLISVVNAAKLVWMDRDAALRAAVLRGDLVLADGMSIVWAARLLEKPLPERIPGIDVMFGLLQLADAHRYRVYLFGASEAVLSAAVRNIGVHYQRAEVVGCHHGYYEPDDESGIADQIAACRPDILFVANSSPMKERFLARFADRLNVPVCLGVGGGFDVLGGKLRRAPPTWQRWGMEWAFRLAQEPHRLWRRYLSTSIPFAWKIVTAYIEGRGGSRS